MSKKNGGLRAPLSVSQNFLSQNFLTSSRTIRRVVALARLNANDHVIEIGPGKGHITRELIKHCGALTAVELDAALYNKLRAVYGGNNNVRLIRRDFLRTGLPVSGEYKIFANIPFSITTDIMRKITETRNPPTDAWLVMEKCAAKRFMGRPFENAFSLSLKPFFDCKIVYYFRREDFHPTPSADAVLFFMRRKETPDIPSALRKEYERFIRLCLSRPGGWRRVLSAKQAAAALRREGLPPLRTAGETLYIQWLCLFRCLL